MTDYFPNTGEADPTPPEVRKVLQDEGISARIDPTVELDPHTGEMRGVMEQPDQSGEYGESISEEDMAIVNQLKARRERFQRFAQQLWERKHGQEKDK
jgi:hypothetical protein